MFILCIHHFYGTPQNQLIYIFFSPLFIFQNEHNDALCTLHVLIFVKIGFARVSLSPKNLTDINQSDQHTLVEPGAGQPNSTPLNISFVFIARMHEQYNLSICGVFFTIASKPA